MADNCFSPGRKRLWSRHEGIPIDLNCSPAPDLGSLFQVQMGPSALFYHFLHFGGYYFETAIIAFGTDIIFRYSLSFSTSTQIVAKTEFL